ncbi:hypothetical protein D3C76_1056640 [compost metagenome]
MDQVLHQVVMLAFLTVGQVFDQSVLLQQIDHLAQAVLQAFLRFFGFYFGHSTLHPQWQSAPLGISTSGRVYAIEVLSNYWVCPWLCPMRPSGADVANNNTPGRLARYKIRIEQSLAPQSSQPVHSAEHSCKTSGAGSRRPPLGCAESHTGKDCPCARRFPSRSSSPCSTRRFAEPPPCSAAKPLADASPTASMAAQRIRASHNWSHTTPRPETTTPCRWPILRPGERSPDRTGRATGKPTISRWSANGRTAAATGSPAANGGKP